MFDPKNWGNASSALRSFSNWIREYEIQCFKPYTAAYSGSILNVGFPSTTTQFCDVFLRCYPSRKCEHNYGDDNDDDDDDNDNNNNKFIVFVVIILIIVIIVLSITILQCTSYISEV